MREVVRKPIAVHLRFIFDPKDTQNCPTYALSPFVPGEIVHIQNGYIQIFPKYHTYLHKEPSVICLFVQRQYTMHCQSPNKLHQKIER